MTTSQSQRISCPNPHCPNPILVQKVSGVVADGTASYVTTTLATKLSLPKAPEEKDLSRAITPAIIGGYGASLLLFALFASLGILFTEIGFVFAWILLGTVFSLLILVAYRNYIKNVARPIKALVPKWDQLYYCRSCDSVFLPRKPDFAPADQMMEFLKCNQ